MVYNEFRMRFRLFALLLFSAGCATAPPAISTAVQTMPDAWQSTPRATRIADICQKVTCLPRDAAGVRIADGKLFVGDKALTPQFREIDSFDVSLERREIVFSAKREDNFDAGLVSLDGSDVHWIPEDRADETAVRWAPRGNKVSYIVRTPSGDFVRTVHIPTAMQLANDFPYARVRGLAWDAPAERYSVVLTSPDASERIVSIAYGGGEPTTVVAPQIKLDVAIEPVRGGILMRPSLLRYSERIPLVVWVDSDILEWNDARGALMRDNRIAMAVVSKPPDADFWKEVQALPWIDSKSMFVVNGEQRTAIGERVIVPSDALAPGTYRVNADTVEVARPNVESFASGWIAQQLKGLNGRR
jgi:hypothetical protein